MAYPLSNRTKELIKYIEDKSLRNELRNLFKDSGALYGQPTTETLERVRFAVIKLTTEKPNKYKLISDLF